MKYHDMPCASIVWGTKCWLMISQCVRIKVISNGFQNTLNGIKTALYVWRRICRTNVHIYEEWANGGKSYHRRAMVCDQWRNAYHTKSQYACSFCFRMFSLKPICNGYKNKYFILIMIHFTQYSRTTFVTPQPIWNSLGFAKIHILQYPLVVEVGG